MLVLLDRDGVLNEDLPEGVTCLEEFRFLPGAIDSVVALSQAGFRVAIITNQSAVGRGRMSAETLASIHDYLCQEIEQAGGRIDAIYSCTDAPEQATHRRKPAPGMLFEALADFDALPERTIMIGDALRDLEAAQAAGCQAILVKTGKGNLTLHSPMPDHVQPEAVCKDVAEAVAFVLAHYGNR